MKYNELDEIAKRLWLAERNYDRKLDKYLKEENPTRKKETTLVAKKIHSCRVAR